MKRKKRKFYIYHRYKKEEKWTSFKEHIINTPHWKKSTLSSSQKFFVIIIAPSYVKSKFYPFVICFGLNSRFNQSFTIRKSPLLTTETRNSNSFLSMFAEYLRLKPRQGVLSRWSWPQQLKAYVITYKHPTFQTETRNLVWHEKYNRLFSNVEKNENDTNS